MDIRSQPAATSAPMTAVGRAASSLEKRRQFRWLWVILALGMGWLKVHAVADVLQYRTGVIAFLIAMLAVSVLRSRPVAIAVTAAPLLAFALAPRSDAVGVAIGVGAFVLLLTLFITIGTLLHAWQDRDRAGA